MNDALLSLAEDLRRCRDLEAFWELSCRELSNFGVTSAMYGAIAFHAEIDSKRLTGSTFIKTNHCSDYLSTFGQDSLIDDDMTAEACILSSSPLLWHTPAGWESATVSQHKRAKVEREMGYVVGVTIPAPCFAPGKFGGLGLSAQGLKPDEFTRMWTDKKPEMIAIAALLDAGMRREHLREIIGLSPRENECLTFLAAGLRPDEIADRLHISYKTIEKYVEGAKKKLKAGTRDCAVAKAMLFNLIHP